MKPSANYPASIWNGSSSTRTHPATDDKAPDYEDWDQLIAEVIAMQNDLHAVDGDNVKTLADVNVIGGVPLIFRLDIADTDALNVDIVTTYKIRVIDAWAVKTTGNGGSGDTVTVKNGTTAITNAMSLNINDKLIVRATSIDDAQHEIAAGGTLRITTAKATSVASIVYVKAIKVT